MKDNNNLITAEHRHARLSAEKARLVSNMIKSYSPDDAMVQLKFINKKASKLIAKVLKSAIANAEHNKGVKSDNLRIKSIEVVKGPALRRFRARSRGMASRINKNTAHIKVVLEIIKNTITAPKVETAPKTTPVEAKKEEIKEDKQKDTKKEPTSK